MKLKDNALQAAGLIFIAHPTLMVKSEADGLVSSTISVEAPAKLKIRCLGNLLELLKVRASSIAALASSFRFFCLV
jgi:hypothetical protein